MAGRKSLATHKRNVRRGLGVLRGYREGLPMRIIREELIKKGVPADLGSLYQIADTMRRRGIDLPSPAESRRRIIAGFKKENPLANVSALRNRTFTELGGNFAIKSAALFYGLKAGKSYKEIAAELRKQGVKATASTLKNDVAPRLRSAGVELPLLRKGHPPSKVKLVKR